MAVNKENTNFEKKSYQLGIISLVVAIIGTILTATPLIFEMPFNLFSKKPSGDAIIHANSSVNDNTFPEHMPTESQISYTVKILMPARLSNASIAVDNEPAKITKRTPTMAWVQVDKKETNHVFTIKNGLRICQTEQLISHNDQPITINLSDCK